MTESEKQIREALAQVKITPYGLAYPVPALDDLEEACTPAAITDLLARLDASEIDQARYEYMIDCDFKAGQKYCPDLNERDYKNRLRAKHDAAIDAAMAQGVKL